MRSMLNNRGAGALLALACALAPAACSGPASGASTEAAADDVQPASQTVVAVVDFSASQTSHAVNEARKYLEDVVNALGYGDRFVLLEMYRTGSRDSVGRFVQDMPKPLRAGDATSYDRRQLEAARRGVLNALPIFFDPSLVRSVPTTDLFTTLHIAAEHLGDAADRQKQLLILSDMLQSTSQFEFAGARRLPDSGWIAAQQRNRLLPSLEDACVIVIGADHTTGAGQRVRSFWESYFEAAGARLDESHYRLRAPTDALDC